MSSGPRSQGALHHGWSRWGPVVAQTLVVAAIAWGAFAFGAVYSWAYWPLLAALTAAGLVAASVRRDVRGPSDVRWLACALTLFGAAVTVQLIPLPVSLVARLSPAAIDVLQRLDLRVAAGAADVHTVSIAPAQTAVALALFAALALTAIGGARLLSIRGARTTGEAIVVIGLVLALTGIVQKAMYTGRIYGFWTPESQGNPFGPFVNRNHFAGWMLMALPIALGLFSGRMAGAMRDVKPEWRARIIWLSSAAANHMLLLAAAALVMTLSLVMTMSRSGITAMTLVLTLTGLMALRRQRTVTSRTITTAYLVVVLIGAFGWVGADAVVARFSKTSWTEFNDRRSAWTDAATVASHFPLAGTGLNTYSVAALFYQTENLDQHYGEAHNDYLQIAAEGGALLAVPAILSALAFVGIVRRRFKEETSGSAYWLRVGAVTGIAAVALQEMVDFSLQMPGNATLFAVLCAIALHRSSADARAEPNGRSPDTSSPRRRAHVARSAPTVVRPPAGRKVPPADSSTRPSETPDFSHATLRSQELTSMEPCRRCGAPNLHRSRTRSRWEGWRKEITGKRPYRCRACGWRGWSIDYGPDFTDAEREDAARALAPPPPNLSGTALDRDSRDETLALEQLDLPEVERPSGSA